MKQQFTKIDPIQNIYKGSYCLNFCAFNGHVVSTCLSISAILESVRGTVRSDTSVTCSVRAAIMYIKQLQFRKTKYFYRKDSNYQLFQKIAKAETYIEYAGRYYYVYILHNTTALIVIFCWPDVILRSSIRTLFPLSMNLVIALDAVLAFTAITPSAMQPLGTVQGKFTDKIVEASTVNSFVCVFTVVITLERDGRPDISAHGTLPALLA